MDQLGETFQEEIKQFPDDYFLTFEMYDLLFDWLLYVYFMKTHLKLLNVSYVFIQVFWGGCI